MSGPEVVSGSRGAKSPSSCSQRSVRVLPRSYDRLMPESGLVSEVCAVDWRSLKSTYGSGEVVRDIILGLASRDEAEVRQAWQQIGETVLQHQGTVYPATAAAAPFLCRIALDEATMWRAALAVDLAFLSAGYDEPYAPAGTAQAVRDAVRPYVGELLGLWGTGDQGLDMALVAVSVAFPVEAAAIAPKMRDWFGRSEPPLRTALGLALGFHSSADDAVRRIIEDEVRQSISWIVRRGDLISYPPSQSGSPRGNEEPYIDSPVPEAIQVARRLQAGAEEQTTEFSPVFSFLMTLMDSGGDRLIKYPG
jgi:hypothetical protein